MKHEVENIMFWKTVIVDLKEQAGHARTLKARINLAKALNDARGYLKYAEGKILHKALIMAVLAAVALSGCRSTITGCGMILQGGAHIVKGTGDYLVAEGTQEK